MLARWQVAELRGCAIGILCSSTQPAIEYSLIRCGASQAIRALPEIWRSWDSRSKLDGKWFAEGKGKGRHGEHEAEPTEYLDREPALRAEHVLACS